MVDGTSGNIVGGESLPERNRIFENGRAGIEINGAATERNQIRVNSIFNNDEKGILLSFGANQGITPPVIDRFIPFSGSAAPNSLVDIFADDAEEGRDYIGGTMADAEGSYTIALDLLPYLNRNLTTTATDVDGNTSEFSLPISIIPPVFTDEPGDVVIVEGTIFCFRWWWRAPEIALSWRFRAPGGGYEPVIANDFSAASTRRRCCWRTGSSATKDTTSALGQRAGRGFSARFMCAWLSPRWIRWTSIR